MSTTYTLRQDANYSEVLQINGKDAVCPFQAPSAIPIQNQFGQPQIGFNRMPCSALCPLAELSEVTKTYTINCGSSNMIFDLSEVAEEVKSESPIIKM
jgi:hypothetical protein